MQYTFKQWVKNCGGPPQVAEVLGVTRQVVSFWLRGEGTPKVDTMLKMVKLSRNKLKLYEIIEYTTRNKKRR